MKKQSTPLATQSEYARHRQVHRSYISRLAQRGILVMRDGLVDVAASDAVLDDRPVYPPADDSAAATPQSSAGIQHPSFAEARTVCEVLRAKKLRLEYDLAVGKVVNAELQRKLAFDVAREARDTILAVPARVAITCAAETDAKKIEALLTVELKSALTILADTVDQIGVWE